MLEYVVVGLAALMVAALTLFSGFGLGTILMPVMALFVPLPVAIAATAVVHLANNAFKGFLVGRGADWGVVARFAIPGAIAAIFGALLLEAIADQPVLFTYVLAGTELEATWVGLAIGCLIIAFALLDLIPRFQGLAFDRKWLSLGGALSGFFGGLSGLQGALRSAFLIRSGLSKEAFIGTSTISAIVVDVSRLLVYGLAFYSAQLGALPEGSAGLVAVAILAAFLGTFLGSRMVKKVTLRTVQLLVGTMLLAIGLGLALGVI